MERLHHDHVAATGCDGPLYSSAVVVRADDPARIVADLHGRHATYNGPDSQSGYNTLRALVAPLARDGRFFGRVTRSGAHRLGLAAVREGRAGCAAVDAVTLALIGRQAPAEADGIRVLAWTAPAPGLPYVTAIARDDGMVARIRQAVLAAAEDDDAADARAALLLSGFATPDRAAYATIDAMETAAQAAGYPVLA